MLSVMSIFIFRLHPSRGSRGDRDRSPPRICLLHSNGIGVRTLKHHTLIFAPHTRARFRKWRLSTFEIGAVIGIPALFTLGGLLAAVAWVHTTFDRAQLEEMRVENADLRAVNHGFETDIAELEKRVEDYEQRLRKLALAAGLPDLLPRPEVGIGGPEPFVEGSGTAGQIAALEGVLSEMGEGMELLERQLDDQTSLISATPAVSPVRGLLTSGFGYRRDPFVGRRAFHRGVDIVAPIGKEVLATGDGVVTTAGRVPALGNAIFISHGFGFATRYGHLSKVYARPGQKVRRGDVIGLVGSTGRSTGAHVHYEVRVEGRAVNPLGYILDRTTP